MATQTLPPSSHTRRGDVAHALVRAVSRLVSTPSPGGNSASEPGVAISGDVARVCACATSSPPDVCEISRLPVTRGGVASRVIETTENRLERFANRKWLIVGLAAAISLSARVLLLPLVPIPKPAVQDEFSYLLASGTFASGRLTNPTPPFPEHFESPQILLRPTYASKYPPFSALMMALGQKLFGEPWIGVWLSVGLMCATLMWALQGWLPPLWAMIGGLFAVVQIGVISYWSESYWGGSCAAIGGALLIGASARLIQRPAASSALGFSAGLAILANTRPFEGLILAIACSSYILIAGPRMAIAKKLILPILLLLLPVGAWMGYFNYRVTGHALRMPYVEHDVQYVIWSPLLWNTQPKPAPTYSNSAVRDFWVIADSELKQLARDHPIKAHITDLRQMGSFFPGWPLIVCAMLFARPLWKDRAARSALLLSFAFYLGAAFDVRLYPHYVAPAAALAYILLACTVRAVRNSWPGSNLERLGVSYGLAALAAIALLSMPQNRFFFGDGDFGRKAKHASIADRLRKEPGQHLVLVKYGPHHDRYEELVYNGADIERSKVVWAHSLGQEKDSELVHYYGGRKVWLLEEDGHVELREW